VRPLCWYLFCRSPQLLDVCVVGADRCYDQAVVPCYPMSLEQLKAFLGKVKGDSNLQEKLKAAKSPEDVVDIAKEHGHEFTADKISQIQHQDLSEAELEGVSGGTYGVGTITPCTGRS